MKLLYFVTKCNLVAHPVGTGRRLHRVLMSSDLKPPKSPKPPKQKAAPVAPPTPTPTPTASQQTPQNKTTATTTTTNQQITIESFLASQPTENKKPDQPAPAPSTNTNAPAQDAPPPAAKKPINFKRLKE
ncbi:MAG: hypothetical protein H0V70_15160 [Ktedonobacteraceae bacterium]|nr:hypothetical protein [Ktedonobacteraceae bacterium]